MNKKAIINITKQKLKDLLFLPEDVDIEDLACDFKGGSLIHIRVSGPGLPDVDDFADYPQFDPISFLAYERNGGSV